MMRKRGEYIRKALFLLLVTLVVLIAVPRNSCAQEEENPDSLVFFLPMKETAITKQIVDLWDTIGKKVGVPIEVMTVNDAPEGISEDQMLDWAKKLALNGKIHITVMPPTGLFRLMEEGIDFTPVVTYQVDKSKYDRPCIMVSENSPLLEIEDGKERLLALEGKKIGIGHGMKSNPVGDMILLDYDIETRSDEFFDYYGTFGGIKERIDEALAGQNYGFLTMSIDMKFVPDKDKLKQLRPLVCGEAYANIPIIFNKIMSREIAGKIRHLLLNIHTDADFPQIKFVLAAVDGHFVPVTLDDYDNWRKVYEKGRREGWIDDIGQATYPTLDPEQEEE